MLRIGEAAAKAGVSERTLRYYEQLGLVAPASHSPGGNRRYGNAELARVRRIRELQELMGLDLEEIRGILAAEDRLDELKTAFWANEDDAAARQEILHEALATQVSLRGRVSAKHDALGNYLDELDARIARVRERLAENEPASSRD